MDYNTLLDMAAELGYRLAMSGAETFRVEESINRVMDAYGIQAESFAIPNCLHVSIETSDGKPMTRMRRIGYHGNNLDAVEKYNSLSRKICREHPEPQIAMQWLKETASMYKQYPLAIYLAGNFLGACGFSIIFGGSVTDSLCAGVCGLVAGLVNKLMDDLKANQFFRIIAASFLAALLAYFAGAAKIASNSDMVIIGALMILVPGLIFTNAMRDIIYGDTNSGINRIVQVFLIAAAIALGTGAALSLADTLWGIPASADPTTHSIIAEAVACFVGCVGFSVLFNIHGRGGLLCAAGGMLTWVTYRCILHWCGNDTAAYFWAAMFASLYSESMARIRKYPAISYLVISIFPLIPGAGVYYTMNYAARGDMTSFASQGRHTIAIAGAIAVGILLISTIFRLVSIWTQRKARN